MVSIIVSFVTCSGSVAEAPCILHYVQFSGVVEYSYSRTKVCFCKDHGLKEIHVVKSRTVALEFSGSLRHEKLSPSQRNTLPLSLRTRVQCPFLWPRLCYGAIEIVFFLFLLLLLLNVPPWYYKFAYFSATMPCVNSFYHLANSDSRCSMCGR